MLDIQGFIYDFSKDMKVCLLQNWRRTRLRSRSVTHTSIPGERNLPMTAMAQEGFQSVYVVTIC